MYYMDILLDLLKNEKNQTNKMYLNELKLKWKKFEQVVEESGENEKIIDSLNEFVGRLFDKKFKYDKLKKKGFKPDSQIFKAYFIEDLITAIVKDLPIFEFKGVVYGKQKFSTNFFLDPSVLGRGGSADDILQPGESPEFLQISQKMDIQLRQTGRRNFSKYGINIPVVIFHPFTEFSSEDFIQSDYFASKSKLSSPNCLNIVVTYSLAQNYKPLVENTAIDMIVVLSDAKTDNKEIKLVSLDIVNEFREIIEDKLASSTKKIRNYKEATIIKK